MKRLSRFVNPFIALIGIQLIWVLVVVFWVVWFIRSHVQWRAVAERISPDLLQNEIEWFILVEGLLLLVAILAGVYIIFLYWRRQAVLYKAQKDFIAQVSHELKSPLASLQLHLETIRRRRPSPEKMEVFLDTMLSDTERLGTLINNLLATSRLEHRGPKAPIYSGNLSEFTANYFTRHRYSLPKAGQLEMDIDPELHVRFDVESLETVFRNLLENALLYAVGPPKIRIALRREGKKAHFTLSDEGRGIPAEEKEKVFRMFYRLRQHGETIRGSGLGLFIVRAIVRLHRGRVWIESREKGTSIHILLPLVALHKQEAKA
jgi:two-component system, OmpR family, phosphate regulon sensor histidine kinase PhoR